MNRSLRAELNALGHEVAILHPFGESGDKAQSPVIRARWNALDAGLRDLGIEPYRPDQWGNTNGQPHAWHTAQDEHGHIFGIWSGSPEQAMAELAESRGTFIVWCVRDWTEEMRSPLIDQYRTRYTTRANEQPIVAPVTDEPAPVEAPAEPEPTLLDGLVW